ncbi:hypothetical protein B0H16DRAFT_26347 [Mycena metata]|uniref:Inner centromere protein ARK-binding domain-containing protein n=1 Tax=Mycena metata TaxID=1033252 RepID=A0AAD7P3K5_9AGAR|nr:hypothetical protein B0H16DRAFT_26347 [Mycena metata]
MQSKENVVPVNSFHRALLQAKEKSPPPKESPARVAAKPLPQQEADVFEANVHDAPPSSKELDSNLPKAAEVDPVLVPPSSPPAVIVSNDSAEPLEVQELVAESQFLDPVAAEQNDLSVIAEDDESERSRASLQGGLAAQLPTVPQETAQEGRLIDEIPRVASPSPADTLQSVPISPAPPTGTSNPVPSPAVSPRPSPSPATPDVPPQPYHTRPAGDYTAPLPEIPPWQPRETHYDMTEPLPSLPPVTEEASNVEMMDVAVAAPPTSPKGLAHKPSLSSFPSLPAPLPFRKSIRAPPDSSAAHGPIGVATPGAALGGKRTSWLMRAREVKALEITVKKPNAPAPSLPFPGPSGSKRKSGDMFALVGATGLEEEERKPKVAKTTEGDVALSKPKTSDGVKPPPEEEVEDAPSKPQEEQGLLVQLKKTVDGLGSRFGKSLGKSLGGPAAANALAEARAAAEARIAERHHKEEEATMALGAPAAAPPPTIPTPAKAQPSPVFHSSHHRLSLSELVTSSETQNKSREIDDVGTGPSITPAPTAAAKPVDEKSKTTIPPDSSFPAVFHVAPPPVFNKPPPVFVPPAPPLAPTPTAQASTFKLPVTTAFSKPASMALGLAPRVSSPKQSATVPLSAQSTLESVQSDALFDSQDSVPAWMPSTQDTEYTSGFGSQSLCEPMTELDEDDSLGAGAPWIGANAREDSLTWSTLPTQSQRGDTGPVIQDNLDVSHNDDQGFLRQPIPGSFNMDVDEDDYGDEHEAAFDQSVLGEMELDPKKSTVSLVEPRSQSQMSTTSFASSQSSQSQGGFFNHASKLVNSVLGTSKKGKPEVKSLQLAAVAAKKQQEEKEKKANRLKEMENRRQAALQRKADEERAKAQEEEKKLKEESERRKKEREEHTDKRPLLKSVVSKKEEENGKKRKIIAEVEKKPELKKPMLKQPALNASTSSKLPSKFLKPQPALASSTTYNTAASTSKAPAENSLAKSTTFAGKGKLVTKNTIPDDDVSHPTQLLQTQMAARAKAQLQAANLAPPTIPSESIELPDINSEYSDSDDEDRPRTFDPPSWAQSPDLRQALQMQSTINPDDIFGAIRPLRMDEVFRNRTGRFRARTSSANWTGTDRLTAEEEREYARRMGFR